MGTLTAPREAALGESGNESFDSVQVTAQGWSSVQRVTIAGSISCRALSWRDRVPMLRGN